jgi:hypothetical protein
MLVWTLIEVLEKKRNVSMNISRSVKNVSRNIKILIKNG